LYDKSFNRIDRSQEAKSKINILRKIFKKEIKFYQKKKFKIYLLISHFNFFILNLIFIFLIFFLIILFKQKTKKELQEEEDKEKVKQMSKTERNKWKK
jgi:hypothetical protein